MVRNSVGAGQFHPLLFFYFFCTNDRVSHSSLLSNARTCVLSDCYVADELLVSRAKRRVRVGNTDAEGRMVMVDLLCEMKEKVLL